MRSVPAGAADPGRAGHGLADPLAVVRYLDVVVLVLAAPFVVLLGAPVLGYAVATAVWICQRAAAAAIEHSAARRQDPRAVLGLTMTSLVGRAWLVGLTILAVGLLAEREDGLMAGITVLVAFTIYFATALVLRPLERKPNTPMSSRTERKPRP